MKRFFTYQPRPDDKQVEFTNLGDNAVDALASALFAVAVISVLAGHVWLVKNHPLWLVGEFGALVAASLTWFAAEVYTAHRLVKINRVREQLRQAAKPGQEK